MDFLAVFQKMLSILFVILGGYLANRLGYLGGDTDRKLSKLLLNLTMPAMILGSVFCGEDLGELATILSILKVALLFYLLAFAFVLLVPPLLGRTEGEKGAWRYAMAFSNVGFIGYPVAVALYGPGALFYAVILALPFNLMAYSLGPLLLVGKSRFQWKALLSPCTLAAALGLLCALGNLRPPALVGELLDFLGSVTVPLSLLLVGSLLAGLSLKSVFAAPRVWVLAALRLLLLPLCLWGILHPLGLPELIVGVAVTQMGMPVAINGTLLSMEYGGDTESLARLTFLTTLGSIVTIPLLAAILL